MEFRTWIRWLILLVALLSPILLACAGEDTPVPPAEPARPDGVPGSPGPTAGAAADRPAPVATEPARPQAAVPSATPVAVTAASVSTVAASPTPAPLPLPTPRAGNSDWAKERLEAVIRLYGITPAGAALLHSLDFRQMRGEPGFFGSYGFDGWAGVGEAKPIGVMHELGHSYWGGFPVIGQPELVWERDEGERLAPALLNYHWDALAFMEQPPDEYELLRERLRNLPGLSARNIEPLLHSLETDLPYSTGGDLALVPPILRKYWGYFMAEGPFETWENAAGWFQSLSHEDRVTAGKFLGLEHFDLRQYQGLPAFSPLEDILGRATDILANEERQRLTDLAEQFDLLIGDSQLEENFQFWRGYLRDKVALQRQHPGHLESLPLPRAGELAEALRFVAELEGGPEEGGRTLSEGIAENPFLVNFLPAVDDRTLVELFSSGAALPEGPTLQATASFVDRLRRFGVLVDLVLAAARRSPDQGARGLEEFLADTGFEKEQDLRLFFDLLVGSDRPLARRILLASGKRTAQSLIEPVPVQLRTIFGPDDLLRMLDITAEAEDEKLKRGVRLLIGEASGNYRIDEPFLEALYEVLADRARRAPGATGRVIQETPFSLEGMILEQPAAVALILSSDAGLAIELVANNDPVLAPPARIVHRLVYADPGLAAEVVAGMEEQGLIDTVTESLAYLAYDKARSERFPDLPISTARDGEFLEHLMDSKGDDWLERRLTDAVDLYRQRMEAAEVSPDFLARYRETLEAAAASLGGNGRERLTSVVEAAFR